MANPLKMRRFTTLLLRDGFTAFTEGKARNTTGGYYVYHAVVDYFKAGNTITDEQINGMRVKDIK